MCSEGTVVMDSSGDGSYHQPYRDSSTHLSRVQGMYGYSSNVLTGGWMGGPRIRYSIQNVVLIRDSIREISP